MNAQRTAKDVFPVVLLALLAALCAGTFLFAPVTVTLDGYSHLYTASALRWMLAGQPAAHSAFTYNSWFIPNWASALLLAALSSVLPPLLALRILILLIAAAFIGGLYFCVDTKETSRGQRAQLLIVLLALALNAFLTLGFYDFLLSTAICFIILGFELRQSSGMPLGTQMTTQVTTQVIIQILLLVAWLAHPLPVALTFLFPLALPGSGTLKQRLRQLWPWALPLGLMAWFYLRLSTIRPAVPEVSLARRSIERLKLLNGSELAAISPSGSSAFLFIFLTIIVMAAIVAAIPRPLVNSRRSVGLLALGIFTTLLFLVVPDGVGDASAIAPRVLLLAILFFVVLAFSKGVVNPVMSTMAMIVSALIVVAFAWEYWTVANRMSPAVHEIESAMATLPPHSRIVLAGYRMGAGCDGPALFERSVPPRHWAAAAAIGKELIVLNDYEGYTSHFPLKYVDGQAENLEELRVGFEDNTAVWASFLSGRPVADYLVLWGAPGWTGAGCNTDQPAPFETLLANHYQRTLAQSGLSHVEIWKALR